MRTLRLSAPALALAAALVACGDDAPSGAPATAPSPAEAEPRIYRFRWNGADEDLPWNRTLYLRPNLDAAAGEPAGLLFMPGDPLAAARGRPGGAWEVSSEATLTRAMIRVLWVFHQRGKFGDEETIDLQQAARPWIRLTGAEGVEAGADTVTVADETGGARLAAVRDPLRGFTLATWDTRPAPEKDVWTAATITAPPRPWSLGEVREGKFAVAARADGRQWVARRVELRPGGSETFDTAAQPRGGGTVVCDDGSAELLLFADVPVPPVRIVRDVLRARWDGVPPGAHEVRFPDGRRVKVEVADGATVTLKRDAK